MDTTTLAPGDRRDPRAVDPGRSDILEVSGLVKRYGSTVAVGGLSFSVREGEFFGLLGPNGAGKTTTVSMISTLFPPDEGTVRVGGLDSVRDANDVRRLIGVVPQEIGIYLTLSARENLEYFGGLYGLRGKELRTRCDELLSVAGLEQTGRKPVVGKFSGGMRRRLNLACGLVHRPRLLLLDEPTVGVDPQSRAHIFEHIQHLNREEGVTVILTTHYIDEAEALCDRVAIMDHGQVQACESVPSLLASISGTVFRISLAEPAATLEETLLASAGVTEVQRLGELEYQVVAADQAQGLQALLGAATNGLRLRDLQISAPSLEQVFLKLTGKELRDE